jgi:NitT/TauT family transport system permease protein
VKASEVQVIVMPTPEGVLAEAIRSLPSYRADILITLRSAGLGLLIGMTLGGGVAIISWLSRLAGGLVTPIALIIRSIPIVVMIPVMARVLGYGEGTVFIIAGLICFFPSFVFATSGLRAVPAGANDLFAVLGTGRYRRLLYLALPSSIPSLLIALRISVAGCMLSALTAEYLISNEGLGRLLARAQVFLQVERGWAISVIATMISVVAFVGTTRLERWGQERVT